MNSRDANVEFTKEKFIHRIVFLFPEHDFHEKALHTLGPPGQVTLEQNKGDFITIVVAVGVENAFGVLFSSYSLLFKKSELSPMSGKEGGWEVGRGVGEGRAWGRGPVDLV